MRHTGALRNFASTLQALAERNHRSTSSSAIRTKRATSGSCSKLTQRLPQHHLPARSRKKTPWRFWLGLARAARYTVDYVRYLTPEYDGVNSLKERARGKAPPLMRWFVELPIFRSRAGNRFLTSALLAVERAIPIDRAVFSLVKRERPDVLLVTPLVDIGSDQVDYVKAARRLGIRSALPVLSWDNLTNKGLIRVQPDEVYVWNEAQKAEAVSMHGADPDHVIVTGAMVYDQWFARRPSSTRDEFCARVGLDPARPILLYLCSSPFIAPDEVVFIEQWIAAIRAAPDARVRTAGILIRPHPENRQPWHRFDAMALQNVSVWPTRRRQPRGSRIAKRLLRLDVSLGRRRRHQHQRPDRVRHRRPPGLLDPDACVSPNAGRHAALPPSHVGRRRPAAARRRSSRRTCGRSPAALDDPEGTRRQIEGFVKAFTRPYGLDVEATPRMVEAIERLGASPAPAPDGCRSGPIRCGRSSIPIAVADGDRSPLHARLAEAIATAATGHGHRHAREDDAGRSSTGCSGSGRSGSFAKQHIVPRAVSRLSAVDAPTEEAVAVPRVLQRIERRGPSHHRRPLGQRSRLRAAVLDSLSQLGDDASTVQRRSPGRRLARRVRGVVSRHRRRATSTSSTTTRPSSSGRRASSASPMASSKPRTMSEFDRNTIKLVRQALASSALRRAAPDVHVPAVSQVLAEPRIRGDRRELRGVQAAAAASRPASSRASSRTTTLRFGSTSTTPFRTPRRTAASSRIC